MRKETFSSLIHEFTYHYDLSRVFDDFLTLTLCSFGQIPGRGKSYDEELYLQTIAPYKDSELRYLFPKMLATLSTEMTERLDDSQGYDVLGEFHQEHLPKVDGQVFTPWPICTFMAKSVVQATDEEKSERPLRILDPCCGSGRMLMAAVRECGRGPEYYGIDISPICVKMSAVNMFLSNITNGEVMCADALLPETFNFSYRLSFLPFGVFRITEKEKSKLWHLCQNVGKGKPEPKSEFKPLTDEDRKNFEGGSQLTLFK